MKSVDRLKPGGAVGVQEALELRNVNAAGSLASEASHLSRTLICIGTMT